MRFLTTALEGLLAIELDMIDDERGFFARTFDEQLLRDAGLHSSYPQHSISFNRSRGTLRGLHYQEAPHSEVKIVRCTTGSIWDVAVDLRTDSATFRMWAAFELSAQNHRAVYMPRGFAHGFITLTEAAEVHYLISEPHRPEAARGLRWNDPAIAIAWPEKPAVVSERDASYPDLV